MIKHILSVCICWFTTTVQIWQMVLVVKDNFLINDTMLLLYV